MSRVTSRRGRRAVDAVDAARPAGIESLESRRLLAVDISTPVNIDTSFGAGGVATIDAFDQDAAHSVVVQPDGKIVVAGATGPKSAPFTGPFPDSVTLVRLNPDGTLDSSFGSGGRARFTGGQSGDPIPLLLLGDGSFFVGGSRGRIVSPTGQLVTTFGSDLFVAAARQGDKIVTLTYQFRLARFNADGTPDTTFGTNGSLSLREGITGADSVTSYKLAVQADGRIVVVGYYADQSSVQHAVITRATANGQLDTSFGLGGYELRHDAVDPVAYSVAITSQGKILVGIGTSQGLTLERLNADGTPDTTFSGDGVAAVNAPGEIPYEIVLDGDDNIFLVSNGGSNQTVRRVDADGGDAWSSNVAVTSDGVALIESAQGIALESDGKLIVAGQVQLGDGQFSSTPAAYQNAADFYVFRVFPTGGAPPPEPEPDAALNAGGVLVLKPLGDGDDVVTLDRNNGQARLNLNGVITTYDLALVKGLQVEAGGGDNTINCTLDVGCNIITGDGDDEIFTVDGNDVIVCGDGDDSIAAGGGDDLVAAGGDPDARVGASVALEGGNDVFKSTGYVKNVIAGDGNDVVRVLGAGTISGNDGDDLIVVNAFATQVRGDDGQDTIKANSDAEHPVVVHGGDGSDAIDTGDGHDSIYGGAGSDVVRANNGSDLISGGGGHDDVFAGGGNDRVYGGAGVDFLRGRSGNDRIVGGGGDDLIFGDRGDDRADPEDAGDVLTSIEALLT